MKKKNIIAWSIVVGVILTIGMVCSMVFTLSKINFQLTAQISIPERSRLFMQGTTSSMVEDNMLESAKFEKGGNLLFMNFNKQIQNIEEANPYVKVERIVRRFPNKITVYYSEREAVVLIPVQSVNNAYFVIDTELKVLDYVTASGGKFVNQAQNEYVLPVINYFDYRASAELKVGQTIDNKSLKNQLSAFVGGAFSANGNNNALYEDVLGLASNANFYLENNGDNRCRFTLKTNTNADVVFDIYNINERFLDKVAISWDLFIKQYKDASITSTINLKVYVDQTTHKINIVDTQTGQPVDLGN